MIGDPLWVVSCHLALTSAPSEPVATIGSPNVIRIPSCAIVSVSVCNGVESCLGFRKTTNDDLWASSYLISRAGATGNLRSTQPDAVTSCSATRGPRAAVRARLLASSCRQNPHNEVAKLGQGQGWRSVRRVDLGAEPPRHRGQLFRGGAVRRCCEPIAPSIVERIWVHLDQPASPY